VRGYEFEMGRVKQTTASHYRHGTRVSEACELTGFGLALASGARRTTTGLAAHQFA
jgi:hypothetical protein